MPNHSTGTYYCKRYTHKGIDLKIDMLVSLRGIHLMGKFYSHHELTELTNDVRDMVADFVTEVDALESRYHATVNYLNDEGFTCDTE